MPPVDTPTLRMVRHLVLAVVALGTLGMSIELFLVDHYEDSNQAIPLALAGVAAAILLWTAVRPGPVVLRALQFVMLSYVGAGILGITLHFKATSEFQLEMDPSLAGWPLVWQAIRSTAPPALAPGVMMQLGVLGLVYTYKHPALGERDYDEADHEDSG